MANLEQSKTKQESTRNIRYFSEPFKRQKVEEIDKNTSTVAEICREYEVTRAAVYKWIYKYSRMRKKGIKQIVEAESDTRKILLLKDQVKELERIIGQKQVVIDFQNKVIELAEEQYDLDIKKKFGSMPYTGSGVTGINTTTK